MKPVAIVLFFASFACGQRIVAARAGLVYFAEGTFTVDGKSVRANSNNHGYQLEEGQVAATPRGHAEFLLGPNAVLWTGTGAQVRFDDTRVENTVIALVEGEVMIEIRRSLEDNRLEVDLGALNIEFAHEGIYRIGRDSKTVRVYAGEATLPNSTKLARGEESVDGIVRPFDRREMDELHYWSAYRSFLLEQDSGVFREWGGGRWGQRQHSGFGVTFPDLPGAARIKYQVASEAGLLYYLEGNAVIGAPQTGRIQLPIRLGRDKFLRTLAGKAEVFLGVGVALRMGEDSFLRVLDTRSDHAAAALDEGTAMIEVAATDEGEAPKIRVGDSVTELLKQGLYLFDANKKTLRVYGGEASTGVGGVTIRTKEAQSVSLQTAGPAARFDTTPTDALFKWSAERSFSLFLTPASFMTPWEPAVRTGRYKHKQFGERQDPRPVRRRLPPRF
jgi:hypothetical protein